MAVHHVHDNVSITAQSAQSIHRGPGSGRTTGLGDGLKIIIISNNCRMSDSGTVRSNDLNALKRSTTVIFGTIWSGLVVYACDELSLDYTLYIHMIRFPGRLPCSWCLSQACCSALWTFCRACDACAAPGLMYRSPMSVLVPRRPHLLTYPVPQIPEHRRVWRRSSVDCLKNKNIISLVFR